MDVIELAGVRAYGKHGATESERLKEQPLDIDLVLEIDLRAASSSDCLERTLDYAKLHDRIVSRVRERSYRLLERLAADLLDIIFKDVRVRCAEIAIAKSKILDGATPRVRLRRTNPRYLP